MSEITINNLTTVDLNGTGTFDSITRSFEERLKEQWSEGRIKGTDYATVYLGMMQTAMQQAIAFELGRQEASAQVDLIAAQTAKVVKETVLLDKEGQKLDAEIALVNSQVTLSAKQLLALDAEIDKTKAETSLINTNQANAVLQGFILVEEKLKVIAETSRIAKEELLIIQNTTNAALTATLILRQQEKTEAETQLLKSKNLTEQAQYLDIVNGEAVVGIIGKQKKLYQAQTDGFSRDAEQKLAKIMADSWSVRRSTDEAENPAGTGLTNVEINKVLAVARAGIGAT